MPSKSSEQIFHGDLCFYEMGTNLGEGVTAHLFQFKKKSESVAKILPEKSLVWDARTVQKESTSTTAYIPSANPVHFLFQNSIKILNKSSFSLNHHSEIKILD